ncbi:hypothetical protein B7463_g5545, partial [Scytalidium lignicola]
MPFNTKLYPRAKVIRAYIATAPVVQDGMQLVADAELVSAVSNAGGLGVFLATLGGDAADFYRSSRGFCTTWSYFLPRASNIEASFQPPWTPSSSNVGRETLVGGMEIYTDKSSLSTQLKEPWFQELKRQGKEEGWHARMEEMVAWYPVGGFVARTDLARPFGGGVIVLLARFTCKDEEGKKKIVEILSNFAKRVKVSEPGVLTYSVMTRPKAPTEVLMFERYQNENFLKAHEALKELGDMLKSMSPYLDSENIEVSQWDELDNAFVGNIVGGGEKAKL